jgi:Flp pilus assembly protein TadB
MNKYKRMFIIDILWILALIGVNILLPNMNIYARVIFIMAIIITIAAAVNAYKEMRKENCNIGDIK